LTKTDINNGEHQIKIGVERLHFSTNISLYLETNAKLRMQLLLLDTERKSYVIDPVAPSPTSSVISANSIHWVWLILTVAFKNSNSQWNSYSGQMHKCRTVFIGYHNMPPTDTAFTYDFPLVARSSTSLTLPLVFHLVFSPLLFMQCKCKWYADTQRESKWGRQEKRERQRRNGTIKPILHRYDILIISHKGKR